MNIKQVIFFLSLLALYLSMVHGQTGHLTLSRTEKVEQKYSMEIKEYKKALINLDVRLRKDSMTKKYKSIPVERIVQLLESVSVYEKHILNSSFLSLRKFLKKNRCMIENILEEEEILSQNVIHKLYTKTETSFEKIFETYKAHKKAFSSRGLMYYSGIKKIKEIKKTLLTQAFNEEKLGFTGIIEKMHFQYLYKPTHFMIQNPQYVLLPFLAWGAYKMMYPQQEISGNSMSGGNESKMPPQSKKSHFSGPSSTSQQKQKKAHDLEHITVKTKFVDGCLSQSGAECGLYATFHTFSLLIGEEEKKHMLEEALIGLEDYHAVALQAVLNTESSLRDRYEAYKKHYLWWVKQPGNKVQNDLKAKNNEKDKLATEIKNWSEQIQTINTQIVEKRRLLVATDFWSFWVGIEDTSEIKELLATIKKLSDKKTKFEGNLKSLRSDIQKINSTDMTGNNIASDTLEAFFKYFFNVPENEEGQQYLSATNYDSHYKFHDGELFFIDKGSSSYDRMLLGFYAQDCENFADAIKELFTGKTPKPIYIIITTGSASSTIASAGHFTSGKISKVGDNVILECTNSLGKSTGTIESFYGHMKTAYEKGTIDTIIAKETEKRNAISFDANIWETLSSKFTAEQMQWDYLKTELENFEKTCIDYYNHEITYAQHEGTTTLRRKQKNEVESTHKVLFHATNKEFDTFFFDIMTNNSLSIRDNIIKYATYLKQRNINNEKDYQTILSSLTKFKSSKEIVSIIPFNIGNGTFQKLRLEKKDTLLSIEFIDNELAEPQTLLQNLCYKALLVNAYNQIN